jgi:hypothetical protein
MTLDEAREFAKWMAGLFTGMTAQQAVEIRNALADTEKVKKGYLLADAEAAARAAVQETPYANEAIVKIMLSLKSPQPRTTIDATQAMREQVRAKGEAAVARNEADNRLIDEAPPELVREVAETVLSRLPDDEALFLRAKGYLGRPAWRGLVAAELRARGLDQHDRQNAGQHAGQHAGRNALLTGATV